MERNPVYYNRGSIEVWDFIRDQHLNYHLGCALKYICRAGFKTGESKTKDLAKAIHYLQNELENSITTGERIQKGIQNNRYYAETGGSETFDR